MTGFPRELTDRTAVLLRSALARADAMGERALIPLGISGREYGILALVHHSPHPTQRGLGQVLGLDRTTTMKLVADLVARGLLKRERDSDDRRAYRISLTAPGRRLAVRAGKVLAACDDRFVIGRLEPDEVDVLRDLLGRLT